MIGDRADRVRYVTLHHVDVAGSGGMHFAADGDRSFSANNDQEVVTGVYVRHEPIARAQPNEISPKAAIRNERLARRVALRDRKRARAKLYAKHLRNRDAEIVGPARSPQSVGRDLGPDGLVCHGTVPSGGVMRGGSGNHDG